MIKNNKKLVDRVDDAFFSLADWSIRFRWLVVVFTLVMVSGGMYFAGKARADNSLNTFFNHNDPAYVAYLEYLEDFVSDEVVYIMYSAEDKEHGPFNMEVMKTIASLTEALETELPFAREATSLANVEYMRPAGEDEIVVDELLIDFPETQQELLELRQGVMSKPMYVNYLIDETASYGAIIVQMDKTSTDRIEDIIYDPEIGDVLSNVYPLVTEIKLSEIFQRPEYTDQGITFYLSGDVPMNAEYINVIGNETVLLTVAPLVLIVVVSLILFRATLGSLLAPISVVLISITLTIGLLGLLGWPINMFFSIVPTLIIAVGVAQSVHILLEYQRKLLEHGDRQLAVKEALHKVGGPCLMAALTTAAGLWVMSFSKLNGLAQMGWTAPFGVLMTFAFSVTLMVAFMAGGKKKKNKMPRRKMAVHPLIFRIVDKCIAINLKHPSRIIVVSAVLLVFAAIGITQLRNDFNFLYEFKPYMKWRMDTEVIEEHMGGTLRMSYLVDTGRDNGINDPELIKSIEKIQNFAEGLPLVKKSSSLADIVKDLNQTFHNNDSAYFRIPEDPELLAQYLLLYEMSGGEELEEFVTTDMSKTVIELQIKMAYATEIEGLVTEIDRFLVDNPVVGAEVRKTGIGLLWMRIAEYIAETQLVSYSLVFVMIALFMCIAFGSFKVGMLSMIPNLAPVVMALGALGWLDVPLDYMKLLLATVAIGIAVDDTIHLVTRVRTRFYETGNYQSAVRLGLTDVGPALVVTSIILIACFSTYLLSDTTIQASFGVLLGGTIFVALLADLFLMPVLLMVLKPFGKEHAVADEASTDAEYTEVVTS